MISVVSAKYLKDYTIFFTFSDGKKGAVNLSDALWGPIFEPLKDLSRFKEFSVSPLLDTICWENGADISPDYLYDRVES